MLTILIVMLVAAFSWYGLSKTIKRMDGLDVLFGAVAFISTMASIIMCVAASANTNSISDYDETKWQISKISIININDIPTIQRAIYWNKSILEHRNKCHSVWVGIWYSEEVAKLELIKLPETITLITK